MAGWVGTRVTEAVWPEALGVLAYGGAELGAAAIDVGLTPEGQPVKAIAQNTVTGLAVIGSAVALGYGKATDFSKGLLFGSSVGVVLTLLRIAYERATAVPAGEQTRIGALGAMIPRQVGRIKAARTPAGLPRARTQLPIGAAQTALQVARRYADEEITA